MDSSNDKKERILKNYGWSKHDDYFYKICGINSKPAIITLQKISVLTIKKLKDELEKIEDEAKNFKNLTSADHDRMALSLEELIKKLKSQER